MSRNQLENKVLKNVSANPMFTVDSNGNITPQDAQSVLQGGTVLIQAASSGTTPYPGYVCAWWNNACRCASIVTDLGTEKHMKIRSTPYSVASNAPEHDYQIYATLSENGTGPTGNATNGDLHVGH